MMSQSQEGGCCPVVGEGARLGGLEWAMEEGGVVLRKGAQGGVLAEALLQLSLSRHGGRGCRIVICSRCLDCRVVMRSGKVEAGRGAFTWVSERTFSGCLHVRRGKFMANDHGLLTLSCYS